MIGTGGTIASSPTEAGLAPLLSAETLLSLVPAIRELCEVDCLQLFSLDSTDITPAEWRLIAETIRDNYAKYDGFVVTHGTDTMAYTAAALSYMIQESPKPIVLTGAQKPIEVENTDSKANLLGAFRYSCFEKACGVTIVFDGKIISGTRARKTRTKSFSAFSSMNFPEVGIITDDQIVQFIDFAYHSEPLFFTEMNPKVGLLKLTPGSEALLLDALFLLCDGVIIESYGSGGIPTGDAFERSIERGLSAGKTLVVTTQVPNEGSCLGKYAVSSFLKKAQVLEAYDMTTEAIVAKLMYVLGTEKEHTQISERFYSPVQYDLMQKN